MCYLQIFIYKDTMFVVAIAFRWLSMGAKWVCHFLFLSHIAPLICHTHANRLFTKTLKPHIALQEKDPSVINQTPSLANKIGIPFAIQIANNNVLSLSVARLQFQLCTTLHWSNQYTPWHCLYFELPRRFCWHCDWRKWNDPKKSYLNLIRISYQNIFNQLQHKFTSCSCKNSNCKNNR